MEVIFRIRILFFSAFLLLPLWGFTTGDASKPDTDSLQQKPLISEHIFELLLDVHDAVSPAEKDAFRQDLNGFIKKLASKQRRYSSEERFVRKVFYKTHNRYLKHYRQHTDFYELLDKGYYDCISGTAFYTLIFDALGISYQIHELPYHVYLTVETEETGKQLLLESTDNLSGFITDQDEIALRIKDYEQALDDPTSEYYRYSFEIQGTISLKELAGLNYFNEAIVHYNQQNLTDARDYLSVAKNLYPGKRMDALQALIEQVARQQLASSDR